MYSSNRSIPLWICSQIGAREHYAIPNALYQSGRLAGLATDWYAPRSPVLRRLMSLRSKSALLARSEIIPDRLVHSFPLRSLLWKRRLSHPGRRRKYAEVLGQTDSAFAAAVAKLKLPPHDIFFGYSYGSLEMLAAEKHRGARTLLGQIDPGALECQLVAEEMSRFPELAGPPPEFPVNYYERNRQEWELADRVVVNSAFSRDALIKQGVDPLKLVVIPLCFEPQIKFPAAADKTLKPAEPLRVLFLGQVILRKGIHYLMKAASQLDPGKVHFDVVGPLGIKAEALAAAPPNVTFHGRSTRDQAATWYRQSDIFVLPTLSDGFAITQLEAMSYGLPVVTTPCCGEVVSDGVDGFVIPPRSPEELVKAFQKYLIDPEILVAQRQAALRKASQFAMERLAKNLQDVEMSLF
jgi:glycosyltransferase involved in cell wall biosynthesis